MKYIWNVEPINDAEGLMLGVGKKPKQKTCFCVTKRKFIIMMKCHTSLRWH